MSGNRNYAPRTTQGRKRRAPAMQYQMEAFDSTENEFAPLPEKRRARGSGVAIQPSQSRQNNDATLNTETTTRRFQTPMNSHDSFVKGESSSEASGFSSVEASTPNPQHFPMAFVKPEVYQELDVMGIKDEAPQTEGAPDFAAIPPKDQECYRILHYTLTCRLRFLFFSNKEQVDLRKLEPLEATDSDFGNWTSHKILRFFASILPVKLMNVYKLFKFPSQLIEHLHCRDLYIENQECQVFWYELIGLTDEMYNGVLESLWKLKYGCDDGYQRWKGKEHLAENMDVGREEVVSYEGEEEGKEEDREPGLNEEEEKIDVEGKDEDQRLEPNEKVEEEEECQDRWDANLEDEEEEEDEDEEEDEEKEEKQIVEKEGEVYLEPKFFEEAPMVNANGAVPNGGQPAPELKCEPIQHHRNLHAHAQEDFLLAPAPISPTIALQAPAPHPSEEQQANIVLAPAAASMQRVLEMAAPVAHPADLAQATPQVRPPPDAPRFDAERLSELLRLGILVLSPPADPVRIDVQAPPQILEQHVLAPAPPDAPPVVWPPLQEGWQQGLGVPAPAPPDAAVQAPPGWHQALGYWAPPPAAFQPIPEFPLQEEAYGQRFELCMEMRDILEKLAGAREQQVPELLAPAPQAAHPAVWAQQQFNGFMDIPPLVAPPPAHVQEQLEQLFPGINAPPPAAAPPIPQHVQGLPQGLQQLRPGILSPPLPAPAPIDQHLGVQAPPHQHQHRFPGFRAPAPVAVPPMAPFAQAQPLFHPHSHLVLVPRDGQPYAIPPYRPPQ